MILPMKLERMTQSLRAAIDTDDWPAMAAIYQEINATLSNQKNLQLTATEGNTAIGQLHKTHLQAQARCAQALEKMEQHLQELGERKDGWVAYALSNEFEQGEA